MNRAVAVPGAILLCVACASEPPGTSDVAEGITTLAEVMLLDDGMARLDGQRMPLEAVILRLRLRVRAMDAAQLAAFGVRIVEDPDLPESAVARLVAARDRLLLEINVMEIGYVKY